MKFSRHIGTHNVITEVSSEEYRILRESFTNQTTLLNFLPGCMFIVTRSSLQSFPTKDIFCEFELEFVGYDEKGK